MSLACPVLLSNGAANKTKQNYGTYKREILCDVRDKPNGCTPTVPVVTLYSSHLLSLNTATPTKPSTHETEAQIRSVTQQGQSPCRYGLAADEQGQWADKTASLFSDDLFPYHKEGGGGLSPKTILLYYFVISFMRCGFSDVLAFSAIFLSRRHAAQTTINSSYNTY